jgi:chromosome partitioning protein
MGEIYAISMNKGGVGKTSLVSNLAGAVSDKMKKKVLIIDTDGQGSSSEAFGYEPDDFNDTMYDVLMGDKKPEDVVIKVDKYLHILPSNSDLNFLEFDVLTNFEKFPNPYSLLENAVKEFTKQYDYVFIDTPPSMGLIQMNVLKMANKVIIPVVPEKFAVKGLPRILKAINDYKKQENPELEISGVVIMMVDYRTFLHSEYSPMIKKYCEDNGIHIFDSEIKDSIRFATATAEDGVPATWTKVKKNDVVNGYFDLTKELFGEWQDKKGILQTLFQSKK